MTKISDVNIDELTALNVADAIGSLTEAITAQTEAMDRLAHSNYALAEAMLAEQDDQGEHTGALDLAGNPI